MNTVTAYQCESCGELSINRTSIVLHEARCLLTKKNLRIKIKEDPTIPRGEVHFRDPFTHETVGKITNIKLPSKGEKHENRI